MRATSSPDMDRREAPFIPSSVQVEDFFHPAPELLVAARRDRRLAGVGLLPPALSLGIGGHPGHVGLEIVAGVFERREQQVLALLDLAEIDRVVADMALPDLGQDAGPGGGVELLVVFDLVRLEADDHACLLYTSDAADE